MAAVPLLSRTTWTVCSARFLLLAPARIRASILISGPLKHELILLQAGWIRRIPVVEVRHRVGSYRRDRPVHQFQRLAPLKLIFIHCDTSTYPRSSRYMTKCQSLLPLKQASGLYEPITNTKFQHVAYICFGNAAESSV